MCCWHKISGKWQIVCVNYNAREDFRCVQISDAVKKNRMTLPVQSLESIQVHLQPYGGAETNTPSLSATHTLSFPGWTGTPEFDMGYVYGTLSGVKTEGELLNIAAKWEGYGTWYGDPPPAPCYSTYAYGSYSVYHSEYAYEGGTWEGYGEIADGYAYTYGVIEGETKWTGNPKLDATLYLPEVKSEFAGNFRQTGNIPKEVLATASFQTHTETITIPQPESDIEMNYALEIEMMPL